MLLMMLMSLMITDVSSVSMSDIEKLIYRIARREGLNDKAAKILISICWVESSHRPRAKKLLDGNSPSYGLCQIKYRTAHWMGYRGTPNGLLDPSTNATYAARYLKYQLLRYARYGDELTKMSYTKSISAYNAGRFTTKNSKYVRKVYDASRRH